MLTKKHKFNQRSLFILLTLIIFSLSISQNKIVNALDQMQFNCPSYVNTLYTLGISGVYGKTIIYNDNVDFISVSPSSEIQNNYNLKYSFEEESIEYIINIYNVEEYSGGEYQYGLTTNSEISVFCENIDKILIKSPNETALFPSAGQYVSYRADCFIDTNKRVNIFSILEYGGYSTLNNQPIEWDKSYLPFDILPRSNQSNYIDESILDDFGFILLEVGEDYSDNECIKLYEDDFLIDNKNGAVYCITNTTNDLTETYLSISGLGLKKYNDFGVNYYGITNLNWNEDDNYINTCYYRGDEKLYYFDTTWKEISYNISGLNFNYDPANSSDIEFYLNRNDEGELEDEYSIEDLLSNGCFFFTFSPVVNLNKINSTIIEKPEVNTLAIIGTVSLWIIGLPVMLIGSIVSGFIYSSRGLGWADGFKAFSEGATNFFKRILEPATDVVTNVLDTIQEILKTIPKAFGVADPETPYFWVVLAVGVVLVISILLIKNKN